MPPMVGGDDSTLVCMSQWSPAGDKRVGGCLQSKCTPERQGTYVLSHDLHRHLLLLLRICIVKIVYSLIAPESRHMRSVVLAHHLVVCLIRSRETFLLH